MQYIRTTRGYTEISTCGAIQLIYDHSPRVVGQWVSNPSAELIASEDWEEYVPLVPEHTPQYYPSEGEQVSALNKLLKSDVVALDDESAQYVASLFPAWADALKKGDRLNVGERYYFDEKLWKVLQTHTAQEDWRPDLAPSLFVRVFVEEWPEWVRPISAETAYNIGDKVTFEGQHYISAINGNSWSPTEYPAGWNLVNE